MTDGYEEIYRTMIDSAGGSGAATDGAAGSGEGGEEPRPLKPVMSDLTASGRAS